MSSSFPTDGDARRFQSGVEDNQLARVGEPTPDDAMSDRSRSERNPTTVIESWQAISPDRDASVPRGPQVTMNKIEPTINNTHIQGAFTHEQHLHVHQPGPDVELLKQVAEERHSRITDEIRQEFNQEARQAMVQMREAAEERYEEAVANSKRQLRSEAHEELSRRVTQSQQQALAEQKRADQLEAELNRSRGSIGELERKLNEQTVALQRIVDDNAEMVVKENRLMKQLEQQQKLVDDLLLAQKVSESVRGNPAPLNATTKLPKGKPIILSAPRSDYGTPLIEELEMMNRN